MPGWHIVCRVGGARFRAAASHMPEGLKPAAPVFASPQAGGRTAASWASIVWRSSFGDTGL